MTSEEWLGGQLARAHMRRSDLRERISQLNEDLHKAMRQLGETDTKIWDLRSKIQRVSNKGAAA